MCFFYKYYHIFTIIFLSILLLGILGCNQVNSILNNVLEETPPAWVSNGVDLKRSEDLDIFGIGMSEKDSETADEMAILDVYNNIEKKILNWETSFMIDANKNVAICFETGNGVHTGSDNKHIEYNDNIRKSIIRINKRWYDKKEGSHYSLAILCRSNSSEKLNYLIRKKIEDIIAFYLSGLENENKKNFINSLMNYEEALKNRVELDNLLQIYRIIMTDTEKDCQIIELNPEGLPPSLSAIQESKDRLIRGIDIICLDGDNQIGYPNYSLSKEFFAKVIFKLRKGSTMVQYPLTGIPVRFSFDSSEDELGALIKSDKDGYVRSGILKMSTSKNKIKTISAYIYLKEFPELKKKRCEFQYEIVDRLHIKPLEKPELPIDILGTFD